MNGILLAGDLKKKGDVQIRVLRVREKIGWIRHDLWKTFSELGKEVYTRMESGGGKEPDEDAGLEVYKTRLEKLQAELRQYEEDLKEIHESVS